MFKRFLSLVISGTLLMTIIGIQPLVAQTRGELQTIEKFRVKVLKLGTGSTSRIEVKLRDQTKVKGYISDAGQDSFTVADPLTGATQKVEYANVIEVKKPGGGPSTRTWIIIGAAAAAAVIVGIAVKPALCDGGAQSRFPC